jgi:hypothetical protein
MFEHAKLKERGIVIFLSVRIFRAVRVKDQESLAPNHPAYDAPPVHGANFYPFFEPFAEPPTSSNTRTCCSKSDSPVASGSI